MGLADDVEVTTEANPDSVDPAVPAGLARGGFTRVSFGMQSAVPHVLSTLDRTPRPRAGAAAGAVGACGGFEQVSLDLIYGTPGESGADWGASLDAAVASEPDHVSAYALIVEDGTAMAAGGRDAASMPAPDDDDIADKYLLADERLTAAGLAWYELSNWARRRRSGAVTTSSTGRAPTGGGSGRARTATSAACGGGTSGTPRRTRPAWPRARARARPVRCSTTRPAGSSGCCWRAACPRVVALDVLDDEGRGERSRGSRRGLVVDRR